MRTFRLSTKPGAGAGSRGARLPLAPAGVGLADLSLAVASAAATAAAAALAPSPSYQIVARTPDALAYFLICGGAAALLWRRSRPLVAVAVATVAALAYHAAGYAYAPVSIAVLVALYGVAVQAAWRRWLPAAVTAVGLVLTARVVRGSLPMGWEMHGYVIAGAAATGCGAAARTRRAYVAALQARAESAERTREEEARRRANKERLHLARDVHDVVAHSLGVITVQAGVAAHLLDTRPEHAREALVVIADAGRQALRDLRATLNVLRTDNEGAPRAPAPGLAALELLVKGAARSGVSVEVCGEVAAGALPDAVDLAAYRIVQEALTNVARHAGTARATVVLSQLAGTLLVEVADDGLGAPQGTASGLGIAGMHERAVAVGGTVEAGPRPDGGFRVRARLPL